MGYVKCLNGTTSFASQIKEAVFLKDTGYFVTETMVFIPVPDCQGGRNLRK